MGAGSRCCRLKVKPASAHSHLAAAVLRWSNAKTKRILIASIPVLIKILACKQKEAIAGAIDSNFY
jgi:hypothetical protein